MNRTWKERFSAAGWIVSGLVLLAVIVWGLQHRGAKPREVRPTLMVTLTPPPPAPPPVPRKPEPQRAAQAPAAPAARPTAQPPKPKTPPAPKAPAPKAQKAIAIDAPPDTNPFQIAQGLPSADSFTIGGGADGGSGDADGGGGGGGGCSTALQIRSYLNLINAQVSGAFKKSSHLNTRNFDVRAQLWFDAAGGVRRTQLERSTGDRGLDDDVSEMLLGVSIGEGVPSCLEPVKVRLTAPWTGVSKALGKTARDKPMQESGTLIWQRPR
ncbi:Uncharacterised protein [Bordetella ansorpii]|uniref:Uncharacterized protein n=1 Tax=Bordetella ansorpii TaxID=288768 RepID=A0A157Q3Q2_9BORD|nr:hypothetical protein [Bordetella ansorpii]SAI40502.1 Uncharacterised protein [Bordetella ansorpii]